MQFENIQFNCIKGIPIQNVETRTLRAMGFPVDVPFQPEISTDYDHYLLKISNSPLSSIHIVEKFYLQSLLETGNRDSAFANTLSLLHSTQITAEELAADLQSNCVFNLEAEEVETIIEEFIFIVQELLPGQLSDLYYSFDIKPNPAYALFFDFATDKLGIVQCTNRDLPGYGQFVEHAKEGIQKRFLAGETLLSIYEHTCASKSFISDIVKAIPHDGRDSIELILFSLSRRYRYTRTNDYREDATDFAVYKDGHKLLNIIFLWKDELESIDDYSKYLARLYLDEHPLLVMDYYELCDGHPSTTIRKALKDPRYIRQHNAERIQWFEYEKASRCSYFNYKYAETASICGCYSCGRLFKPTDITDWHLYTDLDDGGYAYCPYCGDNTVIMDSQGFEITESFIEVLRGYYEEYDYCED